MIDLCRDSWPLVRSDFLTVYGIRLPDSRLKWRAFRDYLTGLVHNRDSLVARYAIEGPEDDPDDPMVGGVPDAWS